MVTPPPRGLPGAAARQPDHGARHRLDQGVLLYRAGRGGAPHPGIGHQIARGVRGGAIVDLEAVGNSIRSAVHAAEEMPRADRARRLNLSGGFAGSRIVKTEIDVARREISDADMRQVLERGYRMRGADDRQVIHSIPVGFSIDESRGIRDPRGMVGERLAVNMHIVTAAAANVRNHTLRSGAPSRSRGARRQPVRRVLPASLRRDGSRVTVIDMGGGTTTIGVFFDGNLVFADTVPVGAAM